MIDPVSLGIFFIFSAVSTASGVWLERRRTSGMRADLAKAKKRHVEMERHLNDMAYQNRHLTDWNAALNSREKELTLSRDKYRKMAESHEVKYAEPADAKPPKLRSPPGWEERMFINRPPANMANIEQEMAAYLDEEVVLHVRIMPSHANMQTKFANAAANRQGRHGVIEFHGTGRRALSDLWSYLIDPDTGYVAPRKLPEMGLMDAFDMLVGPTSKGDPLVLRDKSEWTPIDELRKQHERLTLAAASRTTTSPPQVVVAAPAINWVDEDSPLPMQVKLQVYGKSKAVLPAVHTVEIAVVQTDIQIIEVEKIVERVVEVEKASAAVPDQSRIEVLVSEAVARHLAEVEVDIAEAKVRAAARRKVSE